MAYDQTGAAVGAAGHYAAAMTSALITTRQLSIEDALDAFNTLLTSTFEACEALKGEQPAAPAAPSRGGGRSYGNGRSSSGGGNAQDPGTVDFRGGKYAGKTIADVYADDPDYLEWCANNLKNDFMVGRINAFLATAA